MTKPTQTQINEYVKSLDDVLKELYEQVETAYLLVLHDTLSDEFQIIANMRDVFSSHAEAHVRELFMNNLQIKDIAFKRAEAIENYISSYIKQAGLMADEIVLVEKHSDDGLRFEWYCEPKTHLTQRTLDDCPAVTDGIHLWSVNGVDEIRTCKHCGKRQ